MKKSGSNQVDSSASITNFSLITQDLPDVGVKPSSDDDLFQDLALDVAEQEENIPQWVIGSGCAKSSTALMFEVKGFEANPNADELLDMVNQGCEKQVDSTGDEQSSASDEMNVMQVPDCLKGIVSNGST